MNMKNLQVKKVAVYCRIEKNDLTERCNIDVQKDFADSFIHLNKYELYDYYVDDCASGTTPIEERPEGSRLLQDAADKRFDTVLVYSLGNIGCETIIILKTLQSLVDNGISVRSMTEPVVDTSTPTGLFFISVLSNIAEWEAKMLATANQ